MFTSERELGLRWAQARVVGGSRLRHPSGAEMEALHLNGRGAPLFAVFHRPIGTPQGFILVCSPPYAEAARNQRREVLFGWLASERGLAVVRFHSRGCGHSSGDTADMSLDTMQEDAEAVASEAAERLEAPVLGFVGARLGAVVAHRVAATHMGTAVVWWQPVLDQVSYMRELSRARRIGEIKRGETSRGLDLDAHLKTEEVLDVLGSPVSRRFRESLFARSLDNAPPGPRRGLIIQMSRHDELQPQFQGFVTKLSDSGWSVDHLVIPDEETWWFGARGRRAELELRAVAMEVIPATVSFFHNVQSSL